MFLKKNNKSKKNNSLLIGFSKIYLFPIYIVAIFLKIYDKFFKISKEYINYKILKKEKEDKIEDWWIS